MVLHFANACVVSASKITIGLTDLRMVSIPDKTRYSAPSTSILTSRGLIPDSLISSSSGLPLTVRVVAWSVGETDVSIGDDPGR